MVIFETYLILVLKIWGTVSGLGCPDGFSTKGYNGNVSITNGGRSCQRWSEQRPHSHDFDTDEFYPVDGSIEAAENFCRNVGNDLDPWCYTNDPLRRWQYCSAHVCQVDEGTCGGTVTTSSGEINYTSELIPWLYDLLKDCLWKLEAPKDKLIKLNMLSTDLKTESVCKSNFIEIYEPGYRHAHLCGNDSMPITTSISNILYIRFACICHDMGFHATYTHVGPPSGTEVVYPYCGGVRLESLGSIENPDRDGDGKYDIIDYCIWTVKAPEKYFIDIVIEWMDIEMSSKCEHDFLEIYDDMQTYGKFCGELGLTYIDTLTNEVTVRFFSDDEVTSKGFMLTFKHFAPEQKATVYVLPKHDITVPNTAKVDTTAISTNLSYLVTTSLEYKSASNVNCGSILAIIIFSLCSVASCYIFDTVTCRY